MREYKTIAISMPAGMVEAIDHLAASMHVNRSAVVRILLQQAINNKEE